jgi:hypothetical protein
VDFSSIIDIRVLESLGAISLAVAAFYGGKRRERNGNCEIERRNDTVRRDEYDHCRTEWKTEIHDMRSEVKEDNNRIYDKMTDGFNRLADQISELK